MLLLIELVCRRLIGVDANDLRTSCTYASYKHQMSSYCLNIDHHLFYQIYELANIVTYVYVDLLCTAMARQWVILSSADECTGCGEGDWSGITDGNCGCLLSTAALPVLEEDR